MKLVILYEVYYPKKDAWVSEKTVANTLRQFTEMMQWKSREFKVQDAWPVSDTEVEAVYYDADYKAYYKE